VAFPINPFNRRPFVHHPRSIFTNLSGIFTIFLLAIIAKKSNGKRIIMCRIISSYRNFRLRSLFIFSLILAPLFLSPPYLYSFGGNTHRYITSSALLWVGDLLNEEYKQELLQHREIIEKWSVDADSWICTDNLQCHKDLLAPRDHFWNADTNTPLCWPDPSTCYEPDLRTVAWRTA
jgi:hypothetical protein